jgi:hypothetical protein
MSTDTEQRLAEVTKYIHTLTGIHLVIDGDAWRATRDGFVDIQESRGGFGDLPEEAVADLKARERQP